MRWLFLCLALMAFMPLYQNHDTQGKVDAEFKNLENDVQSREFTVLTGTPTPKDLRIGEIVIISSGAAKMLLIRVGEDIYSVNMSCNTIWR